MGTSGAYGGTPGWGGVSDQTEEWLAGGAGADATGGAGDAAGGGEPGDRRGADTAPPARPALPAVAPAAESVLRALARSLAGPGSAGAPVRSRRSAGPSARPSGGRSVSRASTAGGRALAGAYGVRTGASAPVAELGLDLAELLGLPRHEQARRIVDAALRASGDVTDSEIRAVNARVVLWALHEEVDPAPVDLASRWIVEYVWEVWITEAGRAVRGHDKSGYDSVRAEAEMRAVLEASVSARGLPEDRPVTTADFSATIDDAVARLTRIGGDE